MAVLCYVPAASSPRLQRCVAAAKEAGAPEEWLQEKYTSIRKGSTHGHQAFRILCFAGPGECCAVLWFQIVGPEYQGLLFGANGPFATLQATTIALFDDWRPWHSRRQCMAM